MLLCPLCALCLRLRLRCCCCCCCCRGWRTFKRPGVEDFIRSMAQYYELVVYTSQLPTYADPILDRLDPQRMIQYRWVWSVRVQGGRASCWLPRLLTSEGLCFGCRGERGLVILPCSPCHAALHPPPLLPPLYPRRCHRQAVPRQHAVRQRQARARSVQAQPRHAAGHVCHRGPRRLCAAARECHQGVCLARGGQG